MSFSCNVAVNGVSFGQTSIAILREMFNRGKLPYIFPIGPIDIAAQKQDQTFNFKLKLCVEAALANHQRNNTAFKLWHLNGGLESYSDKQVLMTFYELDSPTKEEVNICKNNYKVVVTSEYTRQVLEDAGVRNAVFVPLGFDAHNFSVTGKKYWQDDRIVFNLLGKFENRKHHGRVIQAWLKKYGNNPKFALQLAVYNPFFTQEQNQSVLGQVFQGRNYGNVNILGGMAQNEVYNDFLNSAHIVIGMSGGEGFGLPEFHSVALGKHAVLLDAHAYKTWGNAQNAVMVPPNGKLPVYDGVFFRVGEPFNQGNIFSFSEDDFISACEEAIKRVQANPVNTEGLKLQETFSYKRTVDSILNLIEG